MIPVALDSYESLVDYARSYSEDLDNARWILGDCANTINTRYGDRTMDELAKDIGQHRSTLYQYAKVANFYPEDIRHKIRDTMQNITYSHMRDALRLGDVNKAVEWLEFVSDTGKTVDEASHDLTEQLGRETRESITGEVSRKFTQEDGYFLVIKLDHDSEWNTGTTVTLKVR